MTFGENVNLHARGVVTVIIKKHRDCFVKVGAKRTILGYEFGIDTVGGRLLSRVSGMFHILGEEIMFKIVPDNTHILLLLTPLYFWADFCPSLLILVLQEGV